MSREWIKSNATAGGGSTQRFRELANGDTEWETTYPNGTVWHVRYTSNGLKVAEQYEYFDAPWAAKGMQVPA